VESITNTTSPMKILLTLVALLACCATHASQRPNILIFLTDDLGFSDIGCYGSEIETPHLDRLAAQGLRFTQFYNTAKCHASRVSLLSGQWCRQAGDESLRHSVTVPEMLHGAGYMNLMTGKWHLEKEPTDFGFDRYFGHLSGYTNFFTGDNTFRLNGQAWQVPQTGFYTTVAKVDHALTFLEEARKAQKPWFLYVAFNAPHAPLQPLKQDYERYLGRYDAGWDVVRDARLAKQKQLGLFGKDIQASPRPDHIPAWKDLPDATRDWEARRMTALAAMIDRVDQEIGRLVRDLENKGELDNTLILFFSDNGACPYDRKNTGTDKPPYDPTTHWTDSTGWAWARNSPFRYYKQNQYEGGITTPAIAHWPNGIKQPKGALVHEPAHLVDILPTVADITGTKRPASWPGRDLRPLAGTSLRPILEGRTLGTRPPIHLLHEKDRGLRDGKWKLVSFRSKKWELYNLEEDRAELHDLASQHPEIVEKMAAQWHLMAREELHAPESEQKPASPEGPPHLHPEWTLF